MSEKANPFVILKGMSQISQIVILLILVSQIHNSVASILALADIQFKDIIFKTLSFRYLQNDANGEHHRVNRTPPLGTNSG